MKDKTTYSHISDYKEIEERFPEYFKAKGLTLDDVFYSLTDFKNPNKLSNGTMVIPVTAYFKEDMPREVFEAIKEVSIRFGHLKQIRKNPIEIAYFDICRSCFEDGLLIGEWPTNFELLSNKKLAIRIRNNDKPYPYYEGTWSFKNDILSINLDGADYEFKLTQIDNKQWVFDYKGKEFCLINTFDSVLEKD